MTTLRVREDLRGLPPYRQGRAPAPGDTATFKLSSNENPYAPLPSVQAKIIERVATINRYPDSSGRALVEAISQRYDLDPAHVVIGAGSVEVVSQLMRATAGRGDEIVFPWRSFEAYPLLTIAAGAQPIQVPLTSDFRHDFTAMRSAITDRTRLVIVCTPNNPTGTTVASGELSEFIDSIPPEIVVLVDEAYKHFDRDPDSPIGPELLRRHANVVVAHTFSKAYGLAGLRLGYALAPQPVANVMRKVALPFGVTDLAQAAGLASLDAEDELSRRVDALVEARDQIGQALVALGHDLPPSQANFFWLPFGAHTDMAVECFARHGVLVRPFSDEGLRVTIGDQAANDALLAAAGELAQQHHLAGHIR